MLLWDSLWLNVHLATMCNGYGEIRDAAIAVKDGQIAWLGAQNSLPANVNHSPCGGNDC